MDTKTVVIVAIIAQSGLAASMVLATLTHKVYAGFRLWTMFFVTLPACFLLLSLRGAIPDFFSIIVANFFSLFGLVFLQEGTHRFLELPGKKPWRINMAVASAALFGLAWYTYAEVNVSARIIISCSAQAFICLHGGFRPLLAKAKPKSAALYFQSFTLLFYAAFAVVRAVRAVFTPVADIMREGWSYDTFIILVVLLTVVTMMGCLMMTHERSLAEAKEARRSLQTLLSNLRGVAYRVRLGGEDVIEYLSGGVEALTGYPMETFLGKPDSVFTEMVHGDDIAPVRAEVARALEGNRNYASTYRVRDAAGRTRWFWDQGVGVKDEKGAVVFREGFVTDITERVEAEAENARLVVELKQALAEVKTLTGLIPICASCKKIRDDKGYWNSLEQYLCEHTGADFTHGICPECADRLYPLK